MKIPADRLAAQLARGVAPLYVLSCDEPLLVDEALAAIRQQARAAGCGERESHVAERGFDWNALGASLKNLSLFSSRRLVELRLPGGKPGDAGARFLTALAAAGDTGNVFVLLLPALDAASGRSKWATALAEAGVWVELRPPRREQLPAWLRQRLRAAGLDADDAALDLLASRVEGNLLAAKQEIDQLVLLAGAGPVTPGVVRDAVADGARFDVFQLSDAALAGDAARAARVLAGLRREGEAEVLVLWALVRDILQLADVLARTAQGRSVEQALQDAGVWRSRAEAFGRAARRRRGADVGRLLGSAARADQVLKGARPGNAWNALLEVTMELCGAALPLAETA
ncbi:MAG: DNA polymerase III subunit delta [Gammaproteobacteria bacterium]|nr:DNA polymerase III subunit delta [Gammaproteobacteria bacterium]